MPVTNPQSTLIHASA